MDKKYRLIKIQNDLYKDYKDKYAIRFMKDEVAYCYLETKEIYLNIDNWFNPTIRTVFDFLHEIGHLETNTIKMKKCEREFFATVWAINEFNKLGLKLDKSDQKIFQEYILGFRNSAIKRHAKNVPTVEQLTLKW